MSNATILPDGSAFAVVEMPLPADHWIFVDGNNIPPMPFRMGTDDERRCAFNQMVQAASRYAIRASTRNGKDAGFDPDAMAQNFIVGMLGYHTPDGLCGEEWADPQPAPEPFP